MCYLCSSCSSTDTYLTLGRPSARHSNGLPNQVHHNRMVALSTRQIVICWFGCLNQGRVVRLASVLRQRNRKSAGEEKWKKIGLPLLATGSCQTELCTPITSDKTEVTSWLTYNLLFFSFLLPLTTLLFLLSFWSFGLNLEVIYSEEEENVSDILLRKQESKFRSTSEMFNVIEEDMI